MAGPSASDCSSTRVDLLLGWFQWIVTPWGAVLFSILGWAVTAPFSTSVIGIGLCWWGVTLLLWSIRAERKWIDIVPFPPLTIIALHFFLRWELGGILLLLSDKNSERFSVWTTNVASALPINALFTSLVIGIPLIANNRFLRHQIQSPVRLATLDTDNRSGRRWVLIGLSTGFVAIGYSLVGYFAGTLDRGPEYMRWAGMFWRPDTLFSATIRLRDLFFLALPLALYALRKLPFFATALLLTTCFSQFLSILLGGRGIVLYPILLTIGGVWISGIRPQTMRLVAVGALAFSIAFIPLTSAFSGTSIPKWDITGRIQQVLTSKPFSNYKLASFGREIYASSDPFLFVEPGVSQQPAGFKRFSNLRYLWKPRIFGESRPEINDGHLVVYELQGTLERNLRDSGRYTSFESITTGGDLYWRFRWIGVLLGGSAFGIFYFLACRVWYRYADLNQNSYTILLALFPGTFLQGPPVRSVLETLWNWLYEIPKYAAILLLLAFIIEYLCRIIPCRRDNGPQELNK